MRRLLPVGSWLVVLGVLGASPAMAGGFDHATWARMLETHTRAVSDPAGTRVDYVGLGADPRWRPFVEDLARRSPPADRLGRMAFWIDTYNVLAIDMVVRHWPVESIRDAGSFFRRVWWLDAGTVDGRVVSLHEIEHETLRPMGDPRIHMAIVCASTSCPSLMRTPFSAGDHDALLDAAVGRFLGDRRKGLRVDRNADGIEISRIFKWFGSDFDAQGGPIGFITRHLDDAPSLDETDREWLRGAGQDARIGYFDYDWSVNALRP